MVRSLSYHGKKLRRLALPIAAVGGVAAALLVAGAVAKTFTLRVARDGKVTSTAGTTATESVVVNGHGRAVYDLSGESKSHPKCTKANGCFQFWHPLTVGSASKLSKAPGIRHKLRVWRRGGLLQVTLGGHPLYTYAGDHRKDTATGEGIKSFGGTWHVIRAGGGSGSTTGTTTSPGTMPSTTPGYSTSTSTTGTTTTPTTTTTPCLYPPCY